MQRIQKEKYLDIMKTQGPDAAVTALHADILDWEYEAFEGREGYQPAILAELEEARTFSRELWDLGLAQRAAQKDSL